MLVKFIYSDGYIKMCTAREADILTRLRRGAVEKAKPTPAPVAHEAAPVAPEKAAKRTGKKVAADEIL